MKKLQYPPLREVIDAIEIPDEDGEPVRLGDWDDELSYKVRKALVQHLNGMRRDVPKPVFGDTTSIENAAFNKAIDDLIMSIEEGE